MFPRVVLGSSCRTSYVTDSKRSVVDFHVFLFFNIDVSVSWSCQDECVALHRLTIIDGYFEECQWVLQTPIDVIRKFAIATASHRNGSKLFSLRSQCISVVKAETLSCPVIEIRDRHKIIFEISSRCLLSEDELSKLVEFAAMGRTLSTSSMSLRISVSIATQYDVNWKRKFRNPLVRPSKLIDFLILFRLITRALFCLGSDSAARISAAKAADSAWCSCCTRSAIDYCSITAPETSVISEILNKRPWSKTLLRNHVKCCAMDILCVLT